MVSAVIRASLKGVVLDNSKTQKKRHPVVLFLGVSAVLVALIMGGGFLIAWLSQGSLFYAHETHQVRAKVLANEPGSMAESDDDKRHFLVLAFDGCESVKQGVRIPPATGVKAKHADLANEIRSCLIPFGPGAEVGLDVEVRRARISDRRTWRLKTVETCDVTRLEMLVQADGETRCGWM